MVNKILFSKKLLLDYLEGSNSLAYITPRLYKISNNSDSELKGHFFALFQVIEMAYKIENITLKKILFWNRLIMQEDIENGFIENSSKIDTIRELTQKEINILGAHANIKSRLNELLTNLNEILPPQSEHTVVTADFIKKIAEWLFDYHSLNPFVFDNGRIIRLLINYIYLRKRWTFAVFNKDEQKKYIKAFQGINELIGYLACKLKEKIITPAGLIVPQTDFSNHSSTYNLPNGTFQVMEWHILDEELQKL